MIVAHNDAKILGGLERWLAGTLSGLQDRGHEVLVLCRNPEMKARFEGFGIAARVHHLGGQIALHDAARLAMELRRLPVRAFLISSFTKSWLAALGARAACVPRVVIRLGLEDYRPDRRFTYRWAFRRGADHIVTNAASMRTAVLEQLPGLDSSRVRTIYNGVHLPPRRAPDGAVRSKLGIDSEADVVCAMARLEPQKELARAVDLVAALGSRTHLLLAGVGDEEAGLRARARMLGVENRVHLVGYREDTSDLLAAADLYVVCSRSEGMSNSMLEAMAAGVPVVSTSVSGASEALDPDPSGAAAGLIVEWTGEEPIRRVRALLDDPEARRRMGEVGRRRVADRFGWERMLDAWERLLAGRP